MKQDSNITRVDNGWQQMHDLLDDKMPQEKKNRKFLFIIFFFACSLLCSIWAISSYNTNTPTRSHNDENVAMNHRNNNSNTNQKINLSPSQENNTENLKETESQKETYNIKKAELSSSNKTNVVNNTKIKAQKAKSKTIDSLEKNYLELNIKNQSKLSNNHLIEKNSKNVLINDNSEFENTKKDKTLQKVDLVTNNNNNNNNNSTLVLASDQKTVKSQENLSATKVLNLDKRQAILASINHLNTNYFISNTEQQVIPMNRPESPKLIEPQILKNNKLYKINTGLSIAGSFLPNPNTYGYSGGLFIEYERNNKWGLGLKANYVHAQRNIDNSKLPDFNLDPIEIDSSSGLAAGDQENTSNILGNPRIYSEDQRTEIINKVTNDFSSFGLSLYGFYSPIKNIRINAGIGLDRFANSTSLNNILVVGPNGIQNQFDANSPFLTSKVFNFSKVIPKIEIGVSYSIIDNLHVFSNYEMALSKFVNEGNLIIKTNRINFGFNYSF